jgi:hypothetical protein
MIRGLKFLLKKIKIGALLKKRGHKSFLKNFGQFFFGPY